jgi:tetratricopeptide (TPR) repeat protein
MIRKTASRWIGAIGCTCLLLAACATDPKIPAEPALRKLAHEMESNGIKQFGKGDYAKALPLFAEAQRLNQSMDDENAFARNGYHQARTALAMGQARAALQLAGAVRNASFAPGVAMLQAQANLELGRLEDARAALNQLESQFGAACAYFGSMNVLMARLALIEGRYEDASTRAAFAVDTLRGRREDREEANAWRIGAAAEMARNQLPKALTGAQNALALDRARALPEKIVRDWLLIGDIQKKSQIAEFKNSYQRALEVAQAAQLSTLVTIATQALKESVP